jgi:hypothetical protein
LYQYHFWAYQDNPEMMRLLERDYRLAFVNITQTVIARGILEKHDIEAMLVAEVNKCMANGLDYLPANMMHVFMPQEGQLVDAASFDGCGLFEDRPLNVLSAVQADPESQTAEGTAFGILLAAFSLPDDQFEVLQTHIIDFGRPVYTRSNLDILANLTGALEERTEMLWSRYLRGEPPQFAVNSMLALTDCELPAGWVPHPHRHGQSAGERIRITAHAYLETFLRKLIFTCVKITRHMQFI